MKPPAWKPRVSYCRFGRKWIMSPVGWRHRCEDFAHNGFGEETFRTWSAALEEALRVYEERRKHEADVLGLDPPRWGVL